MNNIRAFKLEDLDRVMDIWLNSNIEAHAFIDENYWKGNFQFVKDAMLDADILVYEDSNEIIGFIGLTDGYIAGIFVDKKYRSLGIGKKLLDLAKENHEKLTLGVYKNNDPAYKFYIREGFFIDSEELDEENNEIEYLMAWNK